MRRGATVRQVRQSVPAAGGNGSLRLEIRYDRCVECNECAIQLACPDRAIVRLGVPGVAPSRTISGFRSEQESPARVAALRRRDAGVECARRAVPESAAGLRRVYSFPTPTHPEPRNTWFVPSTWRCWPPAWVSARGSSLKRRTRNGVQLLSVGTIAYFGFYRKGCICPIGAIQNVTASLVDPTYMISFGVIAFFFLPLVATLLFGRVFCGGVCPLGAVQDLVLLKPVKVPERLDRALRWLPYVYLGLAVMFAGWGLHVARRRLGSQRRPTVRDLRVGPIHQPVPHLGRVPHAGDRRRLHRGRHVRRPALLPLAVSVTGHPRPALARGVEERLGHAEQGGGLRAVRQCLPVRRHQEPPGRAGACVACARC